jgi:uncharacterized protein (UPF0212 family)
MTYEEALIVLDCCVADNCGLCHNNKKYYGQCEGADFVYRAIDLANKALEKQIPKKPVLYGDSEDGKLLCPNCDEDLWEVKECGFNACPYCGQAIDWSDDK